MPFKSPYNKMIGDKVNQINRNMIDTHHQVESFTPQNPDNSENGNYFNLGISPNTEAIAGNGGMLKHSRACGRKVGGSLYSRAKSAASKVYNVGKKVYDTGKYIYDEAGNLYKKPVSRGLHLASKVAEHYGYGKKRGAGLPHYPVSSGELGMMGNGKIADYMQLGSNLAGYTPVPYLDKALGIGSTLARFAGLGRSGGVRHKQPMDGAGSSGGRRRKGAGIFSNIAHGVGDITGAFGLGRSGAGYSGGGFIDDVRGAVGFGKKKRGGAMKISDALKLAGMVNPAMGVAGGLASAFGLGRRKGPVRGEAELRPVGLKVPLSNVHPEEYAMVDKHTSRGSTASGFGKPKRVNKRAEIVKKVMREHGCSMIDASKYVKAHNMY